MVNVPTAWLSTMVFNVAVPMASWAMVLPVAKCHRKDVILHANATKVIPIAPNPAPEILTAHAVRCVCAVNADPSVVPIRAAQWDNSANVELAWQAVRQIMIVPLIKRASRVNVVILAPTKNRVVGMLYVQSQNIVCFAIVLTATKVNPTKSVYSSSANMTKTVRPTNVVIRVNAAILAWNSVPVALMLSVVLSIVDLSVLVHPISLATRPPSVNHWKVAAIITLAERIHVAPKFLVATNVLAWKVVSEMLRRDVYAMEILSMFAVIKLAV